MDPVFFLFNVSKVITIIILSDAFCIKDKKYDYMAEVSVVRRYMFCSIETERKCHEICNLLLNYSEYTKYTNTQIIQKCTKKCMCT